VKRQHGPCIPLQLGLQWPSEHPGWGDGDFPRKKMLGGGGWNMKFMAFHIFLLENTLFSWRFTGKIIVHDPLNGKISESLMAGWWFKEHEWIMTFHILGIIIPTDFHIFQRGRYTTNQLIMVDNSLIFLSI
jgi:hypothetical protein